MITLSHREPVEACSDVGKPNQMTHFRTYLTGALTGPAVVFVFVVVAIWIAGRF